MNYLYLLIILLPLPILLNRYRGTGDMFTIRITGTMLYTLYLGLLVGFLSTYYYGLAVSILFVAGESYSFGKWVGYLVSEDGAIELDNKKGSGFPFIHQTANFFIPQTKNYKRYCQLALTIRSFYWWSPIIFILFYADLLSLYIAIFNVLILSIGFPIACEVSIYLKLKCVNSKWLIINEKWHEQELIYGLIQFICLNLSIFLTLYFKG